MCGEFFLARMKARWVESGRTIQWVSHALVNQGSVWICLDFNWTPFYTVTELAVHIPSSDLCKIQLALDLQEYYYRGADKSLAQPGRKQAQKHVRDTRDFNKIEAWAVIKSLFLQGKALTEIHAILTETLACFLPGRAKDLSTPLYNIMQEVSVYFNYVSTHSRCRWVYYLDNQYSRTTSPNYIWFSKHNLHSGLQNKMFHHCAKSSSATSYHQTTTNKSTTPPCQCPCTISSFIPNIIVFCALHHVSAFMVTFFYNCSTLSRWLVFQPQHQWRIELVVSCTFYWIAMIN